MAAEKSDLLQGTLGLLILKVVAFGPIHGYAIAQRADGAILRAAKAAVGDAFSLTLADGTVDATVSGSRKA